MFPTPIFNTHQHIAVFVAYTIVNFILIVIHSLSISFVLLLPDFWLEVWCHYLEISCYSYRADQISFSESSNLTMVFCISRTWSI